MGDPIEIDEAFRAFESAEDRYDLVASDRDAHDAIQVFEAFRASFDAMERLVRSIKASSSHYPRLDAPGFYGTAERTFYRTPVGLAFAWRTSDDRGVRQVPLIDPRAVPCESRMSRDEINSILRGIEGLTGETLVDKTG